MDVRLTAATTATALTTLFAALLFSLIWNDSLAGIQDLRVARKEALRGLRSLKENRLRPEELSSLRSTLAKVADLGLSLEAKLRSNGERRTLRKWKSGASGAKGALGNKPFEDLHLVREDKRVEEAIQYLAESL